MKSLSDIRAVVFDAVHTLILPKQSPVITYLQIAARFGITMDAKALGKRLMEAYAHEEQIDLQTEGRASENRERQRWENIVAYCFAPYGKNESIFPILWDYYAQSEAWVLPPEINDLFVKLESLQMKLRIASNFDARLLTAVQDLPLPEQIKQNVLVSSLIGWRKPAFPFFQEVIRSVDCSPEHILFIGDDRVNDLHGAQQAGMKALLLDPEKKSLDIKNRIDSLLDLL